MGYDIGFSEVRNVISPLFINGFQWELSYFDQCIIVMHFSDTHSVSTSVPVFSYLSELYETCLSHRPTVVFISGWEI
jgi:hypothetical protein